MARDITTLRLPRPLRGSHEPHLASSAGVERVFSAAGNMHGDLQKSAKDTTLEHSLFAAFNTD